MPSAGLNRQGSHGSGLSRSGSGGSGENHRKSLQRQQSSASSAGGAGRKTKLQRNGSSATLGSSGSASRMRKAPHRSASNVSSFFGDYDEDRSSPTITDLFLSDKRPGRSGSHEFDDGRRASNASVLSMGYNSSGVCVPIGGKMLLPLPPALVVMLASQAEKREQAQTHKVKESQDDVRAAEAVLESKLLNYFKTFATYPHGAGWDELEECRERLQGFVETFNVRTGLLQHCGERLKCSAYVVVCPQKVALRSEPSTQGAHVIQDTTTNQPSVLHPGQMVVVDSIVVYNQINFLKLRGGGWVFERKNNILCMSYLSCVEIGLWWYHVVSEEYAEVRRTPCFNERVRTGHVLCPGEVCVVVLRCFVDDRCWLHLADGRGWIFEMRPPNSLTDEEEEGPQDVVMAECKNDGQVEDKDKEEDTSHASSVEVGLWEYECVGRALSIGATTGGWLLNPGEKVLVDLRVPANGQKSKETSRAHHGPTLFDRIWLRLHDGRGWVPKTDIGGDGLMRFVKMANPHMTSAARPLTQPSEPEDESWMQGIA